MANKLEKILGAAFLAGAITLGTGAVVNNKPTAYIGAGILLVSTSGIILSENKGYSHEEIEEIYNRQTDRSDDYAD